MTPLLVGGARLVALPWPWLFLAGVLRWALPWWWALLFAGAFFAVYARFSFVTGAGGTLSTVGNVGRCAWLFVALRAAMFGASAALLIPDHPLLCAYSILGALGVVISALARRSKRDAEG